MAIDFPNTPTSGDTYTIGDKTWQWDGAKWTSYGATISPAVLKIDTANSRVGIGTTTPATTLDVAGTVDAEAFTSTSAGGRAIELDSADSGLYSHVGTTSNHDFRLVANGSVALIVKPDGDVGIGTTSPNNILHLHGTTSNHRLVFTNSNNTVGQQGMSIGFDNDRMAFQRTSDTGAWEANYMTIDQDNGNVGIGTTTPNHSLSFGSPSNGTRSLALWENGTAFYGLGNDTNRLAFYASNAAGTAERMVLTSDGNVGIGTTAPINEFHVAVDGAWGGASSSLHSIITSNDGDNGIGIYSGNTKNGYIRFGDTDSQSAGGFNYDHNDNSLKIRTAGTDRWKMDSIGRIQCGNSTSFGGTLGYLNVKGLSNTRGFQVYQPTTSTTAGQYMGFSNVGGTQTNVSKIESNGDFQSATNSYGSLSDERLKTIEPARDYLADLQKLEVKNFRLTSNFVPTQVTVTDDEGNETTEEHPTEGAFVERDEADYSPKQLGLIAQQVEEHIPGLVKEDDYGVKALRYSVLVPMLLQAVQTLTARIETLETA